MIYNQEVEQEDILFNNIIFLRPMILIEGVIVKQVISGLLDNNTIPFVIIQDKKHELIIQADRNKPSPDITINGMLFNIFYKNAFEA